MRNKKNEGDYMGKRMVDLIDMNIDNFFRAESMMTKSDSITYFSLEASVDEIKHHLEINNFDIALLRNNDDSISYILYKDLISSDNITEINRHITEEQMIAPDAPISEIINKFQNMKYLFVFDNKIFLGLITYADLNKYPMQVFCYMAIVEFEKRLKEIVNELFPNDEW
ncbi:MAG: CBS domain-containing protein, partial [Candidatus Hodarchaeales archaeon]